MSRKTISNWTADGLKAIAAIILIIGGVAATDAQTNPPPSTVTTNASKWASSAAIGVTLTGGNTKTALGTFALNSTRKSTNSEALLGASAAYGENNGVKNTESADAFGQYNQNVVDGFYWGLRLEAH